jgi:hypothetical protein
MFRTYRHISRNLRPYRHDLINTKPYRYGSRYIFTLNDTSFKDLKKDVLDKSSEYSQENIDALVETGTKQAINAMNIVNMKLREMDSESLSASITFNAGILQITFSSTHSTSTLNKNDNNN